MGVSYAVSRSKQVKGQNPDNTPLSAKKEKIFFAVSVKIKQLKIKKFFIKLKKFPNWLLRGISEYIV